MRKYTVKQYAVFGCGLACLKSMAIFLNIPTETISNHSKKQLSLLDLIDTLMEAGIKSRGVELGSLHLKNIKKPFIAHLKIGFIKHYVVVYRNYNNKLLIMDPSIGKMLLVKNALFLKFWTKKAIVLD